MLCGFRILLTYGLCACVLSYDQTQSSMQDEVCPDDYNIGDPQVLFEYLYDGIQTNNHPEQSTQDYIAKLQNNPDYQQAVEKCQKNQPQPKPCDPQSPYRTYDGSCNNLRNPTWGIKGECMLKFLPAFYEGSSGIRQSVQGGPLPLPRDLCQKCFIGEDTPSYVSFLFPIIGQFIAHEISKSTPRIGRKSPAKCCPASKNSDKTCDPIVFRNNDTFYSKHGMTCFDNTRTPACATCSIDKRSQTNHVTAAIDGSQIYGTSEKQAKQLRALDGTGKLISKKTIHGELLPANDDPDDEFCQVSRSTCFKAGDGRVNQHSALMSIHNIFLREHNRIAGKLKKLNPNWGEERLFQEARRIVGAELQAIVYKELLPMLLGPDYMQIFNLGIQSFGTYTSYDPNVHIGAYGEFSTCAYRLHSMVSSYTGYHNSKFYDLYTNPNILHGGQMKTLLYGLSKNYAQQFGVWLVDDLRHYLYKGPIGYYGYDMGSLTIERGRDHGIAPYVYGVQYCSNNMVNIKTFDDLYAFMAAKDVDNLKKNYKSVLDIDMWIGMQKENLISGALVGPTSACIIAQQFHALKYGDRFYFEHRGETSSLTPAQIESLRNTTLSRILCDNAEMDKIQLNALKMPGGDNPITPCKYHSQMDLSPWKDKTVC